MIAYGLVIKIGTTISTIPIQIPNVMAFLGDTARMFLTLGLLLADFIAMTMILILPAHYGDEADDKVSSAVKGIKENFRKI